MYRIVGADGRQYGPVSAGVLRRWIAEGRANSQTLAIAEGGAGWQPLGSFPELADAFAPPPLSSAGPVTNSLALWGFIFGLLSVTGCCCCYGFPFNVLGLVFSAVGWAQIRASRGRETGTALAVAGLVLSILSLALGIVLALIGLAFGAHDLRWKFHGC